MQPWFVDGEQSNKVLMKGSTKTTCQINQSKVMEALEISFFIARVKLCSQFNLEENFTRNCIFPSLIFLCFPFNLLGFEIAL